MTWSRFSRRLGTRRLRIRGRSAGFTLVEVLIALTVAGILMAGLFGVLRFGARSWEVGSERAEQVEDLQLLHTFLQQRLGAMRRTAPLQEDGEEEGGFETLAGFDGRADIGAEGGLIAGGNAQNLRFVSTLPAEIGMGGLYVFDLYLADDDTGDLRLDWYVYRPEGLYTPRNPEEQGRVLLSGIQALEFAYLLPVDDVGRGEVLAWQPEWDAEEGLPRAISIDIEFPHGDGRRWPGMVVVPYATRR